MLSEKLRDKSLRDSVKVVTEITRQPRKRVYQLAIALSKYPLAKTSKNSKGATTQTHFWYRQLAA